MLLVLAAKHDLGQSICVLDAVVHNLNLKQVSSSFNQFNKFNQFNQKEKFKVGCLFVCIWKVWKELGQCVNA